MKLLNTVSLIKGNFNVVEVAFDASLDRTYFYKAPLNVECEKGDTVVVPTQTSTLNHCWILAGQKVKTPLRLAKVFMVHGPVVLDYDADYDYKWVVTKLDFGDFEKRVYEDESDVEKLMIARQESMRRSLIMSLPDEELKALEVGIHKELN